MNKRNSNTSQAIILFLKHERSIPFNLKVPNATTLKAMEKAKSNDGEMVRLNEFLEKNEHKKL